ncbi:hypothetical protein [Epilithonimonas caeni]|uniref:hypothetical protein n=1 Tax=Epilithonimonas caeni TaxID=365343 RepID=UPI000407A46D|nr:hypothetical protein [Epilithonimonas caeni]
MKNLSIILITILLISCKKEEKKYSPEIEMKAQLMVDSITKSVKKESALENKEQSDAPVKVMNSRFIEKEYSNYKDVELTYKNISNKDIKAIKFEWYGEDSFGGPADMGITDGNGGGFDDDVLKAGKKRTSEWNVLSRNGDKILTARAYEVVYTDGIKWKAK